MTEITKVLASMGDVGLIVLALAFVFGALTFIPRNLMCFIGGIVFGLSAFPVALISATLGAAVALLVARYLFRSPFRRIAERRPLWKAIAAAVDHEGWRIALLLRIASPIPGTAVNYVFGLTHIGLWQTVCSLLKRRWLVPHYAAHEGCAGWAGAEPHASGTSHAAG
jgi:uncharacterized membrane protein YdjX (TVP38/TMEM64 family)